MHIKFNQMHRFMISFDSLLSIPLLVKCRNIILHTVIKHSSRNKINHLYSFSMFNIVLARVDYFQDTCY